MENTCVWSAGSVNKSFQRRKSQRSCSQIIYARKYVMLTCSVDNLANAIFKSKSKGWKEENTIAITPGPAALSAIQLAMLL